MSHPFPDTGQGGIGVVDASDERDAIIFIPGLAHRDGTEDGAARRLARALDHNARSGSAQFSIEDAKEEDYKTVHKCRVVTLVRKDGDQRRAVADIYQLNYKQALTGDFRRRRPATQALAIGWILLANVGRLIGSIRKPSKTSTEKFQVFYGGLLFILLAAYVPVLLAGVVATGWEAVRPQIEEMRAEARSDAAGAQVAVPAQPNNGARVRTTVQTWWTETLKWLQLAILFITAIGLFTRTSLKTFLAETAAHAVPAINYLDYDHRKGLVLGQVNDLLDHLQERGLQYKRIHVMAYSFGSVVALDAIFPQQQPSPRIASINTLTTIGSPFDFMRTYWPTYFTQRHAVRGTPVQWVNVYSPVDLLGSNFMDIDGRLRGVQMTDDSQRPPDVNLRFGREQQLSIRRPVEYFGLIGFKAHAHYWEREETFDVNCFDDVVREIFHDHWAMA